MGDLFGGGESSTTTVATREEILNEDQKAMLRKLLGVAGEGMEKPAPSMPFSTAIPATQSEQQYAGDIQAARQLGTANFAGPGYLQALNRVLMGGTDQGKLDMWEKEVRPMREAEYYGQGGAIPRLKESLVGSGFRSSDTARSLEQAYLDVGRQMGEEKFQFYNEAENRAAAAAPEAARFVQEGVKTVAGQERAVEEAKVMENMQRWLGGETVNGVANPMNNPSLDLAMKLMFPTYAVGTSSTGASTGAGSGGQIVSSAVSAAGAAAAAAF